MNRIDNQGLEREENKVNAKGAIHVEPRTQKQVFFALKILLSFSNANQEKKSKIMSFLSGYSAVFFKQAFSVYGTWNDGKAEFDKAMEYIDQLRPFDVSRVSAEIDDLRKTWRKLP